MLSSRRKLIIPLYFLALLTFHSDYHKLTFFYYAEEYVNFNDLVTDVFKQYKIRIWMSAVNPASVVNPAGLNQIQPPSAIGPGAIIHTRTTNAPTAIGPGFGNQTYRQQPQQPQQPPRGKLPIIDISVQH